MKSRVVKPFAWGYEKLDMKVLPGGQSCHQDFMLLIFVEFISFVNVIQRFVINAQLIKCENVPSVGRHLDHVA